MTIISQKIKVLTPSPTMALDAKAKALQKEGKPVINLTAGEPDFETPDVVKQAGIKAITDGFSHYTQPEGIPELREAISNKFFIDNNISYDPSDIIVGVGSKQLLYTAFQVLCNPGDEVILAVPTWTTFIEQIKLAGATSKIITLQPPFQLKASDIEPLITQKTKVLLLNTPSNPTGMMIQKDELIKIADLAVKYNIFVIADEIYEKLIYHNTHTSIASLNEKIKQRTLTTNGVSKAYAMTGWRIGYAGGPKEIINAMKSLQSQLISNPTSISQKAAIAALKSDPSIVEQMRKAFEERRKAGLAMIETIPNVSITPPNGAFYFFISIKQLLGGKYQTATAWCADLLAKKHVAIVPGEAFEYPGYVRISYAVSQDNLLLALQRIKEYIEEE
jgi:aspartate aminotransferase